METIFACISAIFTNTGNESSWEVLRNMLLIVYHSYTDMNRIVLLTNYRARINVTALRSELRFMRLPSTTFLLLGDQVNSFLYIHIH